MTTLRTRLALMTGLLLIAQGCGGGPTSTQAVPGGDTQAGTLVSFTVKVPPGTFLDSRPVTVSVWDDTQLDIAEATAGCTASSSGSGQTAYQCPPGVTFRPANPETRQFTPAELREGITFKSTTVTVGERYRLTLGGRAADDCNQAGATAEGTARSQTVALGQLDVYQTMMACASPPPQQ